MFDSNHTKVNENNHLEIGGCDSIMLAKEYGTPLYVLDENVVRESCRKYVDSVKQYYDGNGLILYASKALSTMAIYRILHEEGMGVDVVSGGEMYTAYKAGMPMEKVYFHGNNKTPDELSMALDLGVGRIIVDSVTELHNLSAIAKEKGKIANVMFRIKPGIDAHTHDFVKTGQIDCKFGLALETGEALAIIGEAVKTDNICYCGIHCHIGSQIFDIEPFCEAAHVMMKLIKEIKDTFGADTKELNLGGGFGIAYNEKDDPIPFGNYMKAVSHVLHEEAEKLQLPLPFILMEPGRSIVATAGATLYTVGVVKEIPGIRTYVSVDGGMADNPRYILYQAEYNFTVANRAGDEKDTIVTIAGRCCESGDLLGEHVPLQKVTVGDILAVSATGAYNYSMASHYNRLPNPAMVLVNNGSHRLIIKRESYEDLIQKDIL